MLPRDSAFPFLLLAALLVATSAPGERAAAQAPELHAVREALVAYDLDGDRTIGALRDLQHLQGTLAGAAAAEARFLRAVVALDLLLAARIDPSHATLIERVCDAIATPCAGLSAHLDDELRATARGVYRRAAEEARTSLRLAEALARGEVVALRAAPPAPRRDALLLRAVATALAGGDEASIASIGRDPCAPGATCSAPWNAMDAPSRLRLDAAAEASAALARLERAAAGGDALAQVAHSAFRPLEDRLEGLVVRPPPVLAPSMPVDATEAAGEPARADLVLAVLQREVRIARTPSYGVRAGEIVVRDAGDDVLPGAAAVPLPAAFRPVIVAIDGVVEALRARPGSTVAIAPAPDLPAHVAIRVAVSVERAGRTAMLARRAPDGTLRAAPVALAPRDEVGAPGDVVVHVRMGGYGIARGRGREQSVPRVRRADGSLGLDLEGLAALLERVPRRRTIFDPMPSLPARDLLDAIFRIARPEAPITLAL